MVIKKGKFATTIKSFFTGSSFMSDPSNVKIASVCERGDLCTTLCST